METNQDIYRKQGNQGNRNKERGTTEQNEYLEYEVKMKSLGTEM